MLDVFFFSFVNNNLCAFYSNLIAGPAYPKQLTQLSNGIRCAIAPQRCVRSPYRTLDGTCNNLQNPIWGAANTRQIIFFFLIQIYYLSKWLWFWNILKKNEINLILISDIHVYCHLATVMGIRRQPFRLPDKNCPILVWCRWLHLAKPMYPIHNSHWLICNGDK